MDAAYKIAAIISVSQELLDEFRQARSEPFDFEAWRADRYRRAAREARCDMTGRLPLPAIRPAKSRVGAGGEPQ